LLVAVAVAVLQVETLVQHQDSLLRVVDKALDTKAVEALRQLRALHLLAVAVVVAGLLSLNLEKTVVLVWLLLGTQLPTQT
jgi:hypothetical protein